MTQQAGSPIRYLPIEKDYRQAEKRTSTGRRSDQYWSHHPTHKSHSSPRSIRHSADWPLAGK